MTRSSSKRGATAPKKESTQVNQIPKYPFRPELLTKAQIHEELDKIDYCLRLGYLYNDC
jgi:hypothetical protein